MRSRFLYFLISSNLISFKDVQDSILNKYIESKNFILFESFFSQSIVNINDEDIINYLSLLNDISFFKKSLDFDFLTSLLSSLILNKRNINIEVKKDILISYYDLFRKEMHFDVNDFDYSFLLQLEADKDLRKNADTFILSIPKDIDDFLVKNKLRNIHVNKMDLITLLIS